MTARSPEGTGGAARGVDVAPWLTPAAARAEIGTDSAGGIRLTDASVYDPVRAALGLAGAAEAKGARIFEQSAVRRTRFTRKYADVVLATGTIRTPLIFVATGEPGTLFGQLRRHVRREPATSSSPSRCRRHAASRRPARQRADRDRGYRRPPWLRWLPEIA